jgi:hypothetical protein
MYSTEAASGGIAGEIFRQTRKRFSINSHIANEKVKQYNIQLFEMLNTHDIAREAW